MSPPCHFLASGDDRMRCLATHRHCCLSDDAVAVAAVAGSGSSRADKQHRLWLLLALVPGCAGQHTC